MTGKKKVYIMILLLFSGILFFSTLQTTFENNIFDQLPYNYTSYVSIPPNSENESSIGGYYEIYGKGRDFNFNIVLPGAEDVEDPLCYTQDGLNGTGRINSIDITYNTVMALLSGDFKNAIFNTNFDGVFKMKCAAWTGYGNFSNNGRNFPGNFKINGPLTDWEGTFYVVQENNRIALKADYIYYPHGQKSVDNVRKVKKTYYM